MEAIRKGRRHWSPPAWTRVAAAMFAVGWGANQFSPMLLVYRRELELDAGVLAGLFAIYAATLIPGFLIGGPASDRFGRRQIALPFVALSPAATVLLMVAPHSVGGLAAGRALAGLCSGVVFGAATAWVQELSPDAARAARRSAVSLSVGFGLGPAVSSSLAQWVPNPLVVPYLPHVAIGLAACVALLPVAETAAGTRDRVHWPPRAVRSPRFWLAVAPAAPWVFGSAALAFVVLPQEVTSDHSFPVAFAGLTTALTAGAGVVVQPLARHIEARRRLGGNLSGLACAAGASALGIVAVALASRPLVVVCAALFGFAYGLCLVSGLRESERLGDSSERGAVVSVYYVLAYTGFAAAYLVNVLNSIFGEAATFAVLAVAALAIAAWLSVYADRARSPGTPRRRAADLAPIPSHPRRSAEEVNC